MGDGDLELAKAEVRSGAASVALACQGRVLGRAAGGGLLPLVHVLEGLGWTPEAGADLWPAAPALADRVVGKAAALLAVRAGVRAVWAEVMSQPARDVLGERGVLVEAGHVVPFVQGRQPGQMCPMESLVALMRDPEEGSRMLWAALGRVPVPRWVGEIVARLRARPGGGAGTGAGGGGSDRLVGRILLGYEECTSTNDVLAGLARRGYAEGTVVLARRQTAGRGRLGRRWESPEGGIWMSVLLRPSDQLRAGAGLLVAVGSVAACRALDQVVGLQAGIKWPNDLYWEGRKLGGILAEAGPGYVVLGIGLNAAFPVAALPEPARPGATTVLEAVGRAPLGDLSAALLDELDHVYGQVCGEGPQVLLREWRGRSTVLGKEVLISGERSWTGVAEDIDHEGALLVRRPGGELVRVVAGDVSLRTPPAGGP